MSTPDFRAAVRRRLPSTVAEDEDVVAELAAQLEDAYDAAIARGVAPSEALRVVETEVLNDTPAWRNLDAHLVRRRGMVARIAGLSSGLAEGVDATVRHGRQAARHLRRDAHFTAAVSLTLAACIAVTCTMFVIADGVLFRPLAFHDPDRVVLIGARTIYEPVGLMSDVPSYYERRERATVFQEMAIFRWMDLVLRTPAGERRVRADVVTPSLFRLAGVAPLHGRTLRDGDDLPDAERTVVLGHALWRSVFGEDPQAIGRSIDLNGQAYTVVGVMPEGFGVFNLDAEFWIPARYSAEQRTDDQRASNGVSQVGRLRDGVTLEAARDEMAAFEASERARFPTLARTRERLQYQTVVQPLRDAITHDVRPTLSMLLAGALIVLVTGLLTVTALTIARSRRYRRELAVRYVLGGTWRTMAVHLLAQAAIIAALGGTGALLIAGALLSALRGIGLDDIPRGTGLYLDAQAMVACVAAALGAGVVVGLTPLATMHRIPLADMPGNGAGERMTRAASPFVRRALVTMQIAVALAMTVAMTLVLVSLRKAASENPGFAPDRVFTVSFDMPRVEYPVGAEANAVVHRVLQTVRGLPGVDAAGVTTLLPFGGRRSGVGVRRPEQPAWEGFGAWNYVVSPGYFEAMRIPLVAGRYLDEGDEAGQTPVVVIARRIADRLWPHERALGKRLLSNFTVPPQQLTVVGIVEDVRHVSLTASDDYRGAIYRPYMQSDDRMYTLVAHASTDDVDSATLAAAIDADEALIAAYDGRSMAARMEQSLAPRRLMLANALVFAVGASLLATIGLYSALTYLVAERRREFSIRLALGCPPAELRRLVTVEGLLVTGAGVALGLALVAAVRPLLAPHLHGVGGWEVPIVAAGVIVVAAVSLLAVTGPARAASRVDPLIVLQP